MLHKNCAKVIWTQPQLPLIGVPGIGAELNLILS
jgi:hypothetical protein